MDFMAQRHDILALISPIDDSSATAKLQASDCCLLAVEAYTIHTYDRFLHTSRSG